MNTLQIEILNPKAMNLLKNLAELKLISIRESSDDGFMDVVKRIRTKAQDNPPTLEEITKEVETVRAKRYGKKR